jgi:hypothetical protein
MIQYSALNGIWKIYASYKPREVTSLKIFVSAVRALVPAIFLSQKSSPSAAASWIYYGLIYLGCAAVGITVQDSIYEYSKFMVFLMFGLLYLLRTVLIITSFFKR